MAGVYIHIPYCKRKCLYCSFVSFTDFLDMESYVKALTEEIEDRANGEQIETIYIGGGTPSVLFDGAIKTVLSTVNKCFSVCSDAEITVEVNPESVRESFVEECIMSGINRFSIGLQSAKDSELKSIGRLHDVKTFVNAYNLLREKGIKNINIDLMLGLPGQTVKSLIEGVDFVLGLKPEHISIYALGLEKGCALYGKYYPDEDISAQMYGIVSSRLMKKGYNRYEVSNFALNGKISRHNYSYWIGKDYFGFGTAAHSLIKNVRYENPSDNKDYIAKVPPKKQILTEDDLREEYIMLRLRTAQGIDLDEFNSKFGFRLEQNKKSEINYLKTLNLLEIDNKNLRLKDGGFYIMNQIIIRLI